MRTERVLLHLPDGSRRPVDPEEVYFVEAAEGDCLVRFRGSRRVRDVRTFGEVADLLAPHGFVRIHRGSAVNPRRVREIRPGGDGGWEVRLDPPVNRVLPVSRRQAQELFAAYGEGD
jgi:DNA-binding LytR/AlgR family response regulator